MHSAGRNYGASTGKGRSRETFHFPSDWDEISETKRKKVTAKIDKASKELAKSLNMEGREEKKKAAESEGEKVREQTQPVEKEKEKEDTEKTIEERDDVEKTLDDQSSREDSVEWVENQERQYERDRMLDLLRRETRRNSRASGYELLGFRS